MSPRLTGTTAQDTTAHRTVDCIINPPLHSLLASLAFSHVDERCPHGHRTACSARRCTHNCSRQSGELHAAHEHSIAVVRCPSRPQALGDALRDSVDGPNWTLLTDPHAHYSIAPPLAWAKSQGSHRRQKWNRRLLHGQYAA